MLAVFPSSACPPTAARTCSTSRRCSTPPKSALALLLARHRAGLPLAALVGLPVAVDGLLYNCAALICQGRLIGVVPKTYLPNYREFYEARQFTPGDAAARDRDRARRADARRSVRTCCFASPRSKRFRAARRDLRGPVGARAALLLRRARRRHGDRQPLGVERRRRQARLPPPARRQPVGALHRRLPLQRRRRRASRPPTSPGTATRWSTRTARCSPSRSASPTEPQLALADVDLGRLAADRMRQNTFGASGAAPRGRGRRVSRRSSFPCRCRQDACRWSAKSRNSRTCRATRRRATRAARRSTASRCRGSRRACAPAGTKKLVIGVSGGLDSTQALIVCARAMDELKLPRSNILAFTMPGFATSSRTRNQAWQLMRAVGATRRGNRHPPLVHADAEGHRPPLRQGPQGLRHRLRERAGRRAHQPPVPPRQPARRLRGRHRRPLGAGARLGDLRRRRPHVALQRQRRACRRR